jgi:hypothetical protein
MNTATGQEVDGSSSGPFVLNWTCVPDGRPGLNIATHGTNEMIITWPDTATNWSLVSTPDLSSDSWTLVSTQPVSLNGFFTVQLDGVPQQFFRLRRNP